MEFKESEILAMIYKGDCKASLQLSFKGNLFMFSIDMLDDRHNPDCCIANYDLGIFIRTAKGLKREKYKTMKELKKDCVTKMQSDVLKPLAIIITGVDFSQRIAL